MSSRNSEFGIRNSATVKFGGGYETLDVYQVAFKTAVEVHQLSLNFPKIEQFGGLADQLRRSSKGICANIAEGLSKRMSAADENRFIAMAIGSAEECRVWLSFAEKLSYLNAEHTAELKSAYLRVCQMLFKLQEIRKAA